MGPQVNKYEQVSILGRQMSPVGGSQPGDHSTVWSHVWGLGPGGFLYGEVQCLGTGDGVGRSVYGEVQSTI